jgi:hypothetical protein
MFLTEYNVRGSTVLPKQSITIAFSMDLRMAIEMRTSLDLVQAVRQIARVPGQFQFAVFLLKNSESSEF